MKEVTIKSDGTGDYTSLEAAMADNCGDEGCIFITEGVSED